MYIIVAKEKGQPDMYKCHNLSWSNKLKKAQVFPTRDEAYSQVIKLQKELKILHMNNIYVSVIPKNYLTQGEKDGKQRHRNRIQQKQRYI